ncbi:MAG: CHAT domain-containing protein [Leptolyngbyaceae cyanobacterium SU_3_3]|nr:CHAT domain-containing protein [Leptolyngbyaceae cyanobacterium SU_3_3]
MADLLLSQGRTIEALQVLDLLKVQELQDFFKDIKGKARSKPGIELLPQEQAILQAFKARDKQPISEFFQSSKIQSQLQDLSRMAAQQNLTLPAYRDLQARVQKLGKNVALFYPLILDDRIELVVLTNDRPPVHYPVPVKRTQLERTIQDFSRALQNPGSDAKPIAQQLYTWLIQPLEKDLKQANVKTIVYAPDGQMRYIPLAALYDGNQWLAQRFKINYLTALALTPLDPPTIANPRVLAGAFTTGSYQFQVGQEHFNFRGLAFARTEVEQLAATLPNTTQLFDQRFTRNAVLSDLDRYNILHLATHAAFVPGTPEDSFILLGDGTRINLREIDNWKLPNMALVVLSACQTAVGDKLGNGLEILGFGYQLQRTGTRASIASLWQVDDGGTQTLMDAFYTVLKSNNLTKAEALQKAQIALITGQSSQAKKVPRGGVEVEPDRGAIPRPIGSLDHPYYWAPFILIGNGL